MKARFSALTWPVRIHSVKARYGQLLDAVYTLNTANGGPIDVATENDTANGLRSDGCH